MSQSPELAGGEGFTFEGDAAAFYLAALLAEAYAPGIDDRTVVRVSVQQRDFGEPLDDMIVDFEDAAKNPARLSLQVKRSLTISKAETNNDLRDIIRDSWATLQKPDFRINVDRYGAAVGTITPTKERALKTLCDWARESLTAAHFDARFAEGGSASADIKVVKDDVVALLEEAKGTPCTSEEVHQFFVLCMAPPGFHGELVQVIDPPRYDQVDRQTRLQPISLSRLALFDAAHTSDRLGADSHTARRSEAGRTGAAELKEERRITKIPEGPPVARRRWLQDRRR